MSSDDIELPLPEPENKFAVAAANEGVPVAAIARIILHPYGAVSSALYEAQCLGRIAYMPKPDWPPAQKWDERTPATPASEDFEFNVRKTFGLTNLETGFILVLLKQERADKDRLHRVIEQQRFARQQCPDRMELTDPKMVDVMICKLRKKLRSVDARFVIKTLWGTGYFLEPEVRQLIVDRVAGDTHVRPNNERAQNPAHA